MDILELRDWIAFGLGLFAVIGFLIVDGKTFIQKVLDFDDRYSEFLEWFFWALMIGALLYIYYNE